MARPKVVEKKEVWRVVQPHILALGTLTTYDNGKETFKEEGQHYKVRLTPKGQKPIIRRTYSLANARRILNAKQIDVDRGIENEVRSSRMARRIARYEDV
jgi:ferredoxin-NADP reductase